MTASYLQRIHAVPRLPPDNCTADAAMAGHHTIFNTLNAQQRLTPHYQKLLYTKLTQQVSHDLQQCNGSKASSSQPSPQPNVACRTAQQTGIGCRQADTAASQRQVFQQQANKQANKQASERAGKQQPALPTV
jgi:hypothetical protein